MDVNTSMEARLCWNVGVDECFSDERGDGWMGWVECKDDCDAWLESCVVWFCGRLGRHSYCDSVNAASVSVSTAHKVFNKS